MHRCSELENPIGIETRELMWIASYEHQSCSELENPIGIETLKESCADEVRACCSELENPIGIETLP